MLRPSIRRALAPLVLAGTATACQPSRSDSPDKLRGVIVAYFDSISRKDFARMRSLTTADFIIYENGKVMSNEDLIAIIKGSPITTAAYSFDNVRINVDSSSGSIIYLNHGEFVKDDASRLTRDWLESATFKKVGGEWKLDFIHSTVKK
ncbi:nuclear transport factor 2 family protein [Sorangium sp. So ce854]|uniref:nuclear transport factor 2 family protein n=1 Tax=Sorangium sp. So ce854 TaxID=3133322 RepID=UPI003F5F1373